MYFRHISAVCYYYVAVLCLLCDFNIKINYSINHCNCIVVNVYLFLQHRVQVGMDLPIMPNAKAISFSGPMSLYECSGVRQWTELFVHGAHCTHNIDSLEIGTMKVQLLTHVNFGVYIAVYHNTKIPGRKLNSSVPTQHISHAITTH